MHSFKVCSVVLLLCVILCVRAQVSTKLDLDENSKEQTNTKGSRLNTNSGSTNKVSPKIEGVRVTVDTGDGKKTKEAESKESVEIVDSKGATKRVGIHTDITFEITDDKIDANSTSLERGEKDNDASVPIFKGGRSSTRRPQSRLPYNPKIHINYPGQPEYNHRERDRYNGQGHSIPSYPGYSDEGIYPRVDRWSNVIPLTGVWTTERSSYYIPSRSHHVQQPEVNYRSFGQSNSPHYHHSRDQQVHYGQNQQALGNGHEWQPCVCIYDSRKRGFRSVVETNIAPAIRRSGTSHSVSTKIDK